MNKFSSCPIPEAKRLLTTLQKWREEILAYFAICGASNSPVEAVNNLIKKTRRVAHGFRNFENYRLRVLALGSEMKRKLTDRSPHLITETPVIQLFFARGMSGRMCNCGSGSSRISPTLSRIGPCRSSCAARDGEVRIRGPRSRSARSVGARLRRSGRAAVSTRGSGGVESVVDSL